jgi:hypothetical protein
MTETSKMHCGSATGTLVVERARTGGYGNPGGGRAE